MFLIKGKTKLLFFNIILLINIVFSNKIYTKEEVCAQTEKEISNIKLKYGNKTMISYTSNGTSIGYYDVNYTSLWYRLYNLESLITKSNAPTETKEYILKCSNIVEEMNFFKNLMDIQGNKMDIITKKKHEEEEIEKIKKQIESKKTCIACSEKTSWGDGKSCCIGPNLGMPGIKTGSSGTLRCFCGTGKNCVTTQECSIGICRDGYCVSASDEERKKDITGHTHYPY